MINKSNDLPSFVNENNLPKIVDKLSNASNIKITGNKYGNRVQTVVDKIVEKADNITKAIDQEVVNNSYSFKVGTGDVDVSTDVEDGFGEVGIKGVTYQNLAPKGVALCDDASKFTHNYLHVTVTQQNGFVQCVTNQEGYCVLGYDNRHYNNLIQPNKCYITLAEVEIIKDTSNEGIHVAIPSHISYKEKKLQGEITKGVIAKAFKTNSDVTTNNNGWLAIRLTNNSTSVGDGFKCYYVSLFEISEAEFNNLSIDELIERYNYKYEGIVGVGDKSKNLFNGKIEKGYIDSKGNLHNNANSVRSVDYIKVNPNTDYIISTQTSVSKYIHTYDNNFNVISEISTVNKFITPSNCGYIKFNTHTGTLIELTEKIQIEEGTTATLYEKGWEGHKIEILSYGKNLFSTKLLREDSFWIPHKLINQFDFQGWATISMYNKEVKKIFKPNTTYTMSFKVRMLEKRGTVQVYKYEVGMMFYHQDATPTSFGLCKTGNIMKVNDEQEVKVTFTTPSNLDKYELRIYSNRYAEGDIVQYDLVRFYDIQLEENNIQSFFEWYKEDKLQIFLDEPLMRLPNGVYDEITRDGKLIRRVGKIVFTGIESWNLSKTSDKTILFEVGVSNIKIDKRGDILPICDKLLASLQSNIWVNDIEGVSYTDSSNNRFRIRINKNRLDTQDLTGFKQWLSQNPVTVYYELAEPIVTELPAPYLRIFKDGHLTFNTLVAPESNHVVQLNKSAQIERSIREVQRLDNRINVLENNYDNLMLSTISRLNDLELDYTLK